LLDSRINKRAEFVRRLLFAAGLVVATFAAPPGANARGHGSSSPHSSIRSKKAAQSHPERTEKVRGYTKKNGKHVAPYKRAPKGQG